MSTRRLAGVLGAVALLAGISLAGEVAWQIWGPALAAAQAQHDAARVLDQQWRSPAPPRGPAAVGAPIARITIPRLGPGWSWVLFEGVDQDTLAKGPGHYPGAGQLGQPGNYAIAGHRVGGPFDQAAQLQPCDPITVATVAAVYTYRVLPFDDRPAACPLPPVGVPGQEIVTPDDVAVIAPAPDGIATSARLLTITTCHPRFSARQRLIIHAVLADVQHPPIVRRAA